MKLYYNSENGEVLYAVYDKDLFNFIPKTNLSLLELDIDEIIPNNKTICIDLTKTQWRFNEVGQRKYYIQSGDLYSRDGWEEYENPVPSIPEEL